MEPYKIYGHFYDVTQGQPNGQNYRHLLCKHCPEATTLLEIACGTGAHLLPLTQHYAVTGLDISATMLRYARKRLPGVKLYQQNMAGFKVNGAFDAIICPYDSINHLLKFEDWVRTFQAAKRHLLPGGIFVFDVNTVYRLQELVAAPAGVHSFEHHYLIMDVQDTGAGITDWDIKVFENLGKDVYQLHHEVIKESGFDHERIMTTLRRSFDSVRAYDIKGWSRPKKTSRRLFYVCTKKRS